VASQPGFTGLIDLPQTLDTLLHRYGTRRLSEPVPVADSVVNENYRVATADGPRFVRLHHAQTTVEAVRLEHQATQWAGARGIPVISPLVARDSSTFQEVDGRLFTLYPWMEARQLRADAAPQEAFTLGEMLGRLHAVLTEFTDVGLPDQDLVALLQTERVRISFARVVDAVSNAPDLGDERTSILRFIERRLELLNLSAVEPAGFDRLPCQAIHGDYHQRNVLVDERGGVAAVIDWERVRRAPRVAEVLRCMGFSNVLDTPALIDGFAAGYRRTVQLPAWECELGVALWWQLRLHSAWAYTTRFIDGDLRTHQFLAGEAETIERFSDEAVRADLARRLAGS
jgi:Ser/Thr protein kinase RdoA (MazF antagonist)